MERPIMDRLPLNESVRSVRLNSATPLTFASMLPKSPACLRSTLGEPWLNLNIEKKKQSIESFEYFTVLVVYIVSLHLNRSANDWWISTIHDWTGRYLIFMFKNIYRRTNVLKELKEKKIPPWSISHCIQIQRWRPDNDLMTFFKMNQTKEKISSWWKWFSEST